MHGIIFAEFKKYVGTKLGENRWDSLLKESGIGQRLYLQIQEYPDQELAALVSTAAKSMGKPVPAVLEDFGEFIIPALVSMYKSLIKPEWKTLDFIENTEETIHKVVRIRNPGAKPAKLKCTRLGPNELIIHYGSPRKMCAVAKGMTRGVAKHYHEKVDITETTCMLNGNPACNISVKLVK